MKKISKLKIPPKPTPPDKTETPPPLSAVLDEIVGWSRQFFRQNDFDHHLEALYAAYTHRYDQFSVAPILGIYSPAPGCGKTSKLRFLSHIVRKGVLELDPTAATLYRELDKDPPTLLMDEMDQANWPSIKKIINAGFDYGFRVPRTEKAPDNSMGVVRYSPFGPKVLATMGKHLPDTVADRAITVRMKKASQEPPLLKFKPHVHEKPLKALGERLNEALPTNLPDAELPDWLLNRSRDKWEPLFSVAQAAGGYWPYRALEAAEVIEKQRPYADERYYLLVSILRLEEDWPEDTPVTSTELVSRLNALDNQSWGLKNDGKGLSPIQLGMMLKSLDVGIESQVSWFEPANKSVRQYDWEQFIKGAAHYDLTT